MTDKELWCRMENLATSEPSLERDMGFILLLKYLLLQPDLSLLLF